MQVCPLGEVGYFQHQLPLDEQRQGMHRSAQRPGGNALQRAGVPGGQQVDLVGAQRHGLGDSAAGGHPAVAEHHAVQLHGGKDGGDSGAGQHCGHDIPGGQAYLFAGEHVGRDQVEGDGSVLEPPVVQAAGDQLTQRVAGTQRGSPARHSQHLPERVDGEDVLAAYPAPQPGQSVQSIGGHPPPAEVGRVHRTH